MKQFGLALLWNIHWLTKSRMFTEQQDMAVDLYIIYSYNTGVEMGNIRMDNHQRIA